MNNKKKIKTALISVYHKKGLEKIIELLKHLNVKIYSTGGTKEYIEKFYSNVIGIEEISSYPSILGGRVKTLHPKIFGGILARRNIAEDKKELEKYQIPEIDLVIVDLYPFEETVERTDNEEEIIEKIDIGGISLIRAAAKNYKDVLIIACQDQYNELLVLLKEQDGISTLEQRKKFAIKSFNITSHYDTLIYEYFSRDESLFGSKSFKQSIHSKKLLRYGENPHQKGAFFGDLSNIFQQIHGKELSYNNLLDIDTAIALISEFKDTSFVAIKHNNPCGVASRTILLDAWRAARQSDPVSIFGGILISNATIDYQTAAEINKIFFELIIAPDYDEKALEVLKQKKNRIILILKTNKLPLLHYRSILNGVMVQERDIRQETQEELRVVSKLTPSLKEQEELLFANKIVKHARSNAIVLTRNRQLIGIGIGQTSRIDALKQAIDKAKNFGFDLQGAVMASDAFFPFADCVELAYKNGITAVIQPGGSIRDKDTIEFCNKHNMKMVFTGIRHFRH